MQRQRSVAGISSTVVLARRQDDGEEDIILDRTFGLEDGFTPLPLHIWNIRLIGFPVFGIG